MNVLIIEDEKISRIALSNTIRKEGFAPPPPPSTHPASPAGEYPPFDDYLLQREREIIDWAMQRSDNNISEAARLLRIPRTTLTSKLARLR